jgi:hypothetical protein
MDHKANNIKFKTPKSNVPLTLFSQCREAAYPSYSLSVNVLQNSTPKKSPSRNIFVSLQYQNNGVPYNNGLRSYPYNLIRIMPAEGREYQTISYPQASFFELIMLYNLIFKR